MNTFEQRLAALRAIFDDLPENGLGATTIRRDFAEEVVLNPGPQEVQFEGKSEHSPVGRETLRLEYQPPVPRILRASTPPASPRRRTNPAYASSLPSRVTSARAETTARAGASPACRWHRPTAATPQRGAAIARPTIGRRE